MAIDTDNAATVAKPGETADGGGVTDAQIEYRCVE